MDAPLNLEEDEGQEFANDERIPKKRPKNENQWKRNVSKKARLNGTELRDADDNVIVKGRKMKNIDCNCECGLLLDDCDREYIFESFNAKPTYDLQNEYLRGCTEVSGCTMLTNGTTRRKILYKLHFETRTIKVCQQYFLGLHGLDRGRLRRKVLKREVDIQDRRGKHPNHKRITSDETKHQMRVFLSSLPAQKSHYSRNKNPERRFMESHWTIKELYNEFFTYFPDVPKHQASLTVFREIFNTEYNIKFGFPRSDICDTCSGFLTSLSTLKRNQQENEETITTISHSHAQHLEAAEIFYHDMAAAKSFPDTHFAICMDYQQNMAIPVTGINKEFYLRQLWAYNFGIKDLKSGQATMFLYSEHFAKKGSNEVISCLLYYIQNNVPENVTTLSICCDNPTGQNKNRYVFIALQYLANSRFERIYVKYPVPGHSRMPIDSDFGHIERAKRRCKQMLLPNDITEIVKKAKTTIPNEVVYVNNCFTNDLCSDGTPVVSVKNFKDTFTPLFKMQGVGGMDLHSIREIMFVKDSLPLANFSERFGNNSKEISIFSNTTSAETLALKIAEAPYAYDDFLAVNLSKVSNLETLLQHVAMGNQDLFYATVYGFESDGFRRYALRS